MTRSASLRQEGFGRYGAPTYPFDPGKSGSLTPIRWDNGPGTVVEVKEEKLGEIKERTKGTSTTVAAGTKAAAVAAASVAPANGWMGFAMEHQLSRLIRGKWRPFFSRRPMRKKKACRWIRFVCFLVLFVSGGHPDTHLSKESIILLAVRILHGMYHGTWYYFDGSTAVCYPYTWYIAFET